MSLFKVNVVFVLGVLSVLICGCFDNCTDGSGDMEDEYRTIGEFRSVELLVPGTVYITQGDSGPLYLKTDDNLIDDLRTTVNHGVLEIKPGDDDDCIDPTELIVRVGAENLENLEIDGVGKIVIEGSFEEDDMVFEIDGSGSIVNDDMLVVQDLTVDIAGSGHMNLTVDAEEIQTEIDGSGEVFLSGEATTHRVDIDGSGDVDSFDLDSIESTVDIDGSGQCRVMVSERLTVSIDGSGRVYYRGSPIVTQSIDGTGSVSPVQ